MPEENTSLLTKQIEKDSRIGGVSVRAWILLMLVGTMCLSFMAVVIGVIIDAIWYSKDWAKVGTYTNISEPMYGAIMISIGFYFAQNKSGQKQ